MTSKCLSCFPISTPLRSAPAIAAAAAGGPLCEFPQATSSIVTSSERLPWTTCQDPPPFCRSSYSNPCVMCCSMFKPFPFFCGGGGVPCLGSSLQVNHLVAGAVCVPYHPTKSKRVLGGRRALGAFWTGAHTKRQMNRQAAAPSGGLHTLPGGRALKENRQL